MADQNNCPKAGCGRPESTHRLSGGKRLSICGNGHSWDPVQVAEQRQKAEEARRNEHAKGPVLIPYDFFRQVYGNSGGGPTGSAGLGNRNKPFFDD